MSTYDQLEIIRASGEIEFYELDPGRGITNIGRDPENDIVIESPGVAPFHAVLMHGRKPYHLMALSPTGVTILGGERLAPNVSREVRHWDTIEIDSHRLILLEKEPAAERPEPVAPVLLPTRMPPQEAAPGPLPAPAAALPTAVVAAAGVLARQPDQADDMILTELSEQEFTLDVEQTAMLQVSIANGGAIVAMFQVSVEGLDPDWVTILPAQVNLNEGQRSTVTVAITPPRLPSSRAGAHAFSVAVTSPNYPNRVSRRGATLTINPYYDYAVGELSPRQQTVPWSKPNGQAALPISNKGNSVQSIRLEGMDDERACRFEFYVPGEETGLVGQAEMRLAPEETATIPVGITPLSRSLVSLRKRTYSYTITTTLMGAAQAPRMALGQLKSAPLFGPWLLLLLALGLAVLIALIFRPRIITFGAEPRMVKAGEEVTLSWRASPFANLYISPDVGEVQGPLGTTVVTPTIPAGTLTGAVVYELKAQNFLTRLSASLFSQSKETRIVVGAVFPVIVTFSADRTQILQGETATLFWEVEHAENLVLEANGVPETLPTSEHTGQRQVSPDTDTTYVLRATNRYGEVTENLTVQVIVPTPTPLPTPAVLRFDVLPSEITQGESVEVAWQVTGADKVSIVPINDSLPPNGVVSHKPQETLVYVLTATNAEGKQVTLYQQVTVNPAPTPTPPPKPPVIEFFTISPDEVTQGDDAQLAWSVTGDTTNIKINGQPDFGEVSGLSKTGTMPVAPDKTTVFILTAFNGDLSASQTVQLKVNPPPTPPPPKPVISFTVKATSGTIWQLDPGSSVYYIEGGSDLLLEWDVANNPEETTLTINSSSQTVGPSGDRALNNVNDDLVCSIKAKNAGGQAQAEIQILVASEQAPPPPESFKYESGVFTWKYPAPKVSLIKGFRIYRINGGGPVLVFDVGDLPSPGDPQPYSKALAPCVEGVYYVVAVYYDGVADTDKETEAAETSWGVSCP